MGTRIFSKDKRGSGGFTLIEVMISSAIFVSVTAMVLSVFIMSQRILESAMSQVQLSFELRALREKLLFNIDDQGGLMSAKFSTITANDDGSTLTYTPADSETANVLRLCGDTDTLSADSERSEGWLSSGKIKFDTERPFSSDVSDGELQVDANVRLEIGSRVYSQRQLIRSQLMAE